METLLPILDAFASALPLIVAAAASILVTKFNQRFGSVVPKEYYPIVLPLAGALVAGLAKAVGVDVGDFNPETADLNTWQTIIAGAITGHAMVGIDQIKKQLRKSDDPEQVPPAPADDTA